MDLLSLVQTLFILKICQIKLRLKILLQELGYLLFQEVKNNKDLAEATTVASKIGYPILIKATNGGGAEE